MDITQLEKIGLKEKEAKVYIALLKKGSSLANALAKETNILRSSIYDYLDILVEKGFASYSIQSGKKYFHAVDPDKILNNFEEQKKKEEEALKKIIPELSALQNISKKKANVEVFEGKEGLKTAFLRVLKDNPKEGLVYGSSGVSYKILPFFMEHFHKQRIKQKIHLKIIYNQGQQAKERIAKGPSLENTEIKFLPIQEFSAAGTLVYHDKVMIFILTLETPLAIVIESEDVAKQYKDNFKVLWKISKK